MAWQATERRTFTAAEAGEIRDLLDGMPYPRRASRRIAMARLRRMGLGLASDADGTLRREQFERLLDDGEVRIDEGAVTTLEPRFANVFRISVGVTGEPVEATWNAFDERFQWFSRPPRSLTSGSYLFVLAVDRWHSAVVGLYEAVSAGAARLPSSPDPGRWPWAVGVRPLAAIPPPLAERVEGQIGPQGGPAGITDRDTIEALFGAIAASPPPPGPADLEQRVQEVEWCDVLPDVLEAVAGLGGTGHQGEIVARAIELGEWSEEELGARAWYTGSGSDSHVERVLGQVFLFEVGTGGALRQQHGRYSVSADPAGQGFGVAYRPASEDQPPPDDGPPARVVDLAELDRSTKRHMELQDRLAEALRERGVEPLSPAPWEPKFDLAFEHAGRRFVVEVKGGDPVGAQQVRLGAGQALEYRHLLTAGRPGTVQGALLLEGSPPPPWAELAEALGLKLLRADRLEQSLAALLGAEPAGGAA
jgi:hypothetical protein